jgi:hypothetical protein
LSSDGLEKLIELSEFTDRRGWTPESEEEGRGGLFTCGLLVSNRGLLVGSRGLFAPEGVGGGLGEPTVRGVTGTCPAMREFADFTSM